MISPSVCVWQMVAVPQLVLCQNIQIWWHKLESQAAPGPSLLPVIWQHEWLMNRGRKSSCFATFLVARCFKFVTNPKTGFLKIKLNGSSWFFHFYSWQSGRCAHSQGFSCLTMSLWRVNAHDSEHDGSGYYNGWANMRGKHLRGKYLIRIKSLVP